MQLLCSILLLPFFGTIWALETSENIQLIQGDGGEIYCQGEEDLDFCEWIGPSGEECMIKKGDEQVECGFGVTKIQEGSCFLTFDKGPIPEDAGEYQCKLIGETIVPGTVNVEVFVRTTIEFGGDFAAEGQAIEVQLDPTFVECSANNGIPAPDLIATIVDESGEVTQDLEEVADSTVENFGDSGLVSITKSFIFTPNVNDCGSYVRCQASQGEPFAEPVEKFRKLSVVYQPQPAEFNIPFTFQEGSQTVVGLTFLANPPPEDYQVIWHHSPTQDEILPPPPGSFNLEAGRETEDGRFQALNLNVSGHEVTATLLVNLPGDDMLEGSFYLEANNAFGQRNYPFTFRKYQLITEAPEVPNQEQDEEAATMGTGAIVAIVIIIVAIFAGLGVTIWAKKNNKWCFAKPDYNPTATVDPDSTNIVKNKKPNEKAVVEAEQKNGDNAV